MGNTYIDLLIRIKNGCMVKKRELDVYNSKINIQILKKLKALKLIEDFSTVREKPKKITVLLKYENGLPVITDIKIISKPGKRAYIKKSHLSLFKKTISVVFLSTSKGIMTNKEAESKNIGGELLFEIW